MSREHPLSPADRARAADRFYGYFLLFLAMASAAAPLLVGDTLAWALLLAGILGGAWLALDRSPRGFAAAAGWALVALWMGFHLVYHAFMGPVSLSIMLGVGFCLLGGAEILFGIERFRPGGARYALVLGGLAAAGFGTAVPWLWPDMPDWAGGLAMALMFAGFGLALLIGASRSKSDTSAS